MCQSGLVQVDRLGFDRIDVMSIDQERDFGPVRRTLSGAQAFETRLVWQLRYFACVD